MAFHLIIYICHLLAWLIQIILWPKCMTHARSNNNFISTIIQIIPHYSDQVHESSKTNLIKTCFFPIRVYLFLFFSLFHADNGMNAAYA